MESQIADVINGLNNLVAELEHIQGFVSNADYLRAQNRALEIENAALRDLLYDLGITDPDPLEMRQGAIADIRRVIETAGVV